MRDSRRPLLHFLLIGAALFAVQSALSVGVDRQPRVLRVSVARQRALEDELRRQLGRQPTAAERAASLQGWVDEQLLFREARALGWHRSDPVVQLRLLRNMRFLGAQPDEAPERLLEQAYALGLDRSDVVVQRRLVERLRLAIGAGAVAAGPADSELEALRAREAERLRRPPLVRLTQVFVSRDRHGEALAERAAALGERLVEDAVPPERAAGLGDPLPLPAQLPLSSQAALAARLGPDFARAALAAEPGRWSGPLASSYGLHWVWVQRRLPARDPELEEVRPELEALWREQREREALTSAVAALRREVEVRIEP